MKKRLLLVLLLLFICGHRIWAEGPKDEKHSNSEPKEIASSDEEAYFSLGSLRYDFLFDKLNHSNSYTGKIKDHSLFLIRLGGLKSLFLWKDLQAMPQLNTWLQEKGAMDTNLTMCREIKLYSIEL